MKKRYTSILAVLLLLCFALSACGKPAAPAATAAPGATAAPAEATPATPIEKPTETTKDTITIALQGEPTSLDAQYPDDGNMRPVTDNVLECLFALDGQTLEVIPRLATEMKMIDNVTWEVKLREGVKFHDGDTFDAEDAAFSINRIIDPAFGSQILSDFDTIKEAKVVDANTIQIITKAADPLLQKRLTKLVMLSKSFTEAHTNEQLTLVCNGTGPYKLVKWDRGVNITIERNEEYWGEKPVIKTGVYRFLEEPATRVSALKAGEIDVAVNMYPEYAADMPKAFTEVSYETYWVRFNELSGVMANPKIRLAANLAIDRQSLADALFLGYATPSQGQMGKDGFFGWNPNVPAYEYDVEKAKALLKEAGYNGEKVQFVSERGRWLKDGEVTEAVASMLMEAGFNVEVKIVSWNEWLDTLFNKSKTPDLQFSSTSNDYFDMDRTYSALVHSSGTQAALSNPEYDKQIEAARSELDVAKRQQMYYDLAQELHDDPFAIYLMSTNDLHGGAANLNWTLRKDSKIYLSEMSFS